MTDNITNNDEPRKSSYTPAPWRWQGEDYRGGWGWQMLVGPSGEGLIIGQDPSGGMSKQLRAHQPLDPALCITGMAAHEKEHAEPVHVFNEANARLISASPDLLEALQAVLKNFDPYATPGTDENVAAYEMAERAIAKALGQ